MVWTYIHGVSVFLSVAVGCSSGQSGSVVVVVGILFFVASRTGVVRERVLVQ